MENQGENQEIRDVEDKEKKLKDVENKDKSLKDVENKRLKGKKAEKSSKESKDSEVEKSKNKKNEFIPMARKVLDIFGKIVTIIVILISAIIVTQKVTNNTKSFFGYRIFRVQTGSMIPKYKIGDVILVKEKDISKIKIGDDVTYQGVKGSFEGLLVTHRVIDIENIDGKIALHTQGIANSLEDPIVYGDQINGVVQTKMYVLTLICTMLNNKYVFYFCGILPLTIYVFFRVFKGSAEKYEKRYERIDK